MKYLLCLFLLAVTGCASNPLLTGKPQDWMGKPAEDLQTAWGQPTRTIAQKDGTEIWEYVENGSFNAPAEDRTSFNMGGVSSGGGFGARGGIRTTKRGEGIADYENLWRFQIKAGKVKGWYAHRKEDGKVVWSDH